MLQQVSLRRGRNVWTTILWAGLLVGFLDISAAVINYTIRGNKNPEKIFQYIASALFGHTKAYSGDASMYVWGVLFHFLVAYSFTVLFFLLYPRIRFFSFNRVLTGIIYGLFIWAVMNLVVVPLTQINRFPAWNSQVFIQAGILIVAIGLPLSFIAYAFYKGRQL